MTTETAVTASMFQSFERHLKAERKSPRTLRTYRYGVESLFEFLRSRGMPRDVENIRREHIESFMGDGLERVSPSTVHQWYRSCQQFFKWLVDEDYIDESPMAHMRPPSLPELLPPVLSDDEVIRLVNGSRGRTFEDRRDNAIIRLMLDTGMRLAECAGLTLDTLNVDTQIAIVMGKGSRQRACPFGAKTARALDRYLRMRAARPRAAEPALWLGHKGPMTDMGLYQVIRRRGEQAGIPTLHPHMFRHFAASAWLHAGGGETHLMALMGWRSRSMVGRYAASEAAKRAISEHQRLSLMDRV